MAMKPKQDISYLLKMKEHADTEIEFGIDPDSRVWHFLGTKSDASIQAAKEKLLEYLQTPPAKLPNETDDEYIQKYTQRDEITLKYAGLLCYIK